MENEWRRPFHILCTFFQRNWEKKTEEEFNHIISSNSEHYASFFGFFNQLLLLNILKERCKETYQQLVSCERENLGLKNSEGKFFCWFSTLTTLWIAHKGKVQNMKLGKVGFQMLTQASLKVLNNILEGQESVPMKLSIQNMWWRTKKFMQHNTAVTKSWCFKVNILE